MPEFFALLLIFLGGTLGGAFAIHYFWQIPFAKSIACSAFFILVIIIFWASGLWENASRHSWGILTPIFALLIFVTWLALKSGRAILAKILEKLKK